MSIASKILEIRSTLPDGVELVAVSKFHPVEAIEEAYAAGQRLFGESRVQELTAKYEQLPKDIEWQMIGHLQTNKVRAIAPFVSLIQSVDSQRLLECINREAERCDRVIDCLLEVHVTAEDSKSGWDVAELREYLNSGAIAELKNIRIRGVMGMATFTDDESVIRADFAALREIYDGAKSAFFSDSEAFSEFSIGMSDDYRIAMEYGSTMVRIGSMIFGERL